MRAVDIIVLADPTPDIGGNWRTTPRIGDRRLAELRSITLLNGLTFAGWLFIVASGFSLIFGLMRVVNMAHGSFYLIGRLHRVRGAQTMTGSGYTIQAPR